MARSQRKRQARLEFTPLPSSSPAAATYNQQIRDRAAAVGLQGSPNRSKRRKITHASTNGGDSELSALPTPDASSAQPEHGTETITLDSDSDDPLPLLPSRIRRNKKAYQTTLDLRGPRTSEDSAKQQLSSPLRRKMNSSPAPTPDSGAFFRRNSPQLKALPHANTRSKRSHVPTASDSDEDLEVLPNRKASDNFIELSGNDDDDDDDSDQMPITPATKRHRGSQKLTIQESSDESELEDEPPKSSRLRRGRRKEISDVEKSASEGCEDDHPRRSSGHALTQEEKQELEDDLNDLKSSSSEEETTRRSQKPAKSERALALERLKRARAGTREPHKEVVNIESDEDEEFIDPESSDDDQVQEVIPQSTAREIFDANEDDEDFLADDGDETLGAPDGLPLQFTRYASMKPSELFHFAVEWMVQKKINPGFNITDEIYDLAFKKLDDEVKGLVGSKFESSAWKPDFIFALRARPDMAKARMDRSQPDLMYMDKCDACNRSGHFPSYEVQFQGKPYHPQTLEEVEQHEDSDDESDTEGTMRDSRGQVLPPATHSFFVGKHCMANADMAHSLQHWRYHLYEHVVEKLGELGHMKPAKIVERDGWGEPKRRKFANKLVDQFSDMGTVKELYSGFKQQVDDARNLKQGGRWQGDSP
ncbi:hypothetical protein BDZ85DRAFT_316867 [Elsinoe ampelina]|uniref:DUF4211 domain-containing protein n=1 Tax=Elsinoe ampelina TaxID=302913 RepID=A0A6A6GJF9_9PEZI|nr:hypothetical protein BDZ85DRAFT_316867 [Elsinoe ampelina]